MEKYAVPSDVEVEMPLQMLKLLEEHGEVMSKLIDGSFQDFVDMVCRAFAFVARPTSMEGQTVLQGSDLHYVTEKIHWLMKTIVLRKLGFGEKKVESLVERNAHFNYLRAATAMPSGIDS